MIPTEAPPTTPIRLVQITQRTPAMQIIDEADRRITIAFARNMPFEARMRAAKWWYKQAALDVARQFRDEARHGAIRTVTLNMAGRRAVTHA